MAQNQASNRAETAAHALSPDRLALWTATLEQAEAELSGEPQSAERRAKALSAIVRATADIQDLIANTKAPAPEGDDAPDAARRAFETRIDRIRQARGLPTLFDDGDDYAEADD